MQLRSSVLSLATGFALLLGNALHAQLQPCGTDEMREHMIAQNPDLLRQEQEYEQGLQAYLQARAGLRDDDTTVYVIPVVFHILYDPTIGNDAHNISDAQIYDAMNVLNRDYAKENADISNVCCGFQAIASDVRVQFQLATKDPLGNCTNGIDRIISQRSTNARNFAKLNPWFRDKYLNVWVVRSLGSSSSFSPAGYSQLPSSVQEGIGQLIDGVILLHDYTGSIETSSLNTSRTLTHEVGHYLNLSHTWGNTNAPEVDCGNDGVDDTPVTKGHQDCAISDLHDFTCSSGSIDTVYQFTDVTLTSGSTDLTPVPTVTVDDTLETGLVMSPFTANGVSPNSSLDSAFAFTLWGIGSMQGDTAFDQLTGALDTGHYYEFTVTPETGKAMTLTEISFDAGRSLTGPRTFAVRSSVNSFGSNLSASILPPDTALAIESSNTFYFTVDTSSTVDGCTVTLNGTAYSRTLDPITFRIYAWNAEDAGGYFSVDSLKLKGDFGIVENTQNYMEYSYCSYMFTNGQRDRMRATLNNAISGRSNLWTDGNHFVTGTAGNEQTCGPEAGFYVMDHFACTGTAIQFKDNSTRAEPTSWAWSFEGGNPATSTEENPLVSFTVPGPHSVTLTVGNDFGSSSLTRYNIVYIGADYSEVDGLLNEPFDTEQRFSKWPVVNFEGNQSRWLYDNQNGHNAPGCAKLNAAEGYTLIQDIFNSTDAYWTDKDVMTTPTLDFQYQSDVTLSFWYAYSTRGSSFDAIGETLKIYFSSDCGNTWHFRSTIDGSDLVSAGTQSIGYVPESEDWREKVISMPSSVNTGHVRFKFEFSATPFANDLYIDDINIDAVVSVDELAQSGSMSLMPNPASNLLTVGVDMAGASTGTISFLDMTGRIVYAQPVTAGEKQVMFNLEKLGITDGVYLVRLKHANGQRVERLVVQ